jgi:hypothetical protein
MSSLPTHDRIVQLENRVGEVTKSIEALRINSTGQAISELKEVSAELQRLALKFEDGDEDAPSFNSLGEKILRLVVGGY